MCCQSELKKIAMSNPSDNFPNGLEAIFLVIALFFAEYVVAAILYAFNSALGLQPSELAILAGLLGNGLIFTGLLSYKKISYSNLFHDTSISLTAILALLSIPIICLVPGLLLLSALLQFFLQLLAPLSPQDAQMFEQILAPNLPSIIAACLLAPVLEEMLFRGIILRSFLAQYSSRAAIIGSALIFGAAHLNLYQFFAGFTVGVVLAWLYQRTRSLWPGILLHSALNSAIMYWATIASGVNFSGWWSVVWKALLVLLVTAFGVVCLRKLLPAELAKNRAEGGK